MRYKIGDKVQLSEKFYIVKGRGMIAEIIAIMVGTEFPYRIKYNTVQSCPVYLYEIEPIIEIGQQLEFEFMKEL